MVKFEDECVGCPTEMGCVGNSCPYRNVPHLYCDKCGEEADELYDLDGEQLCADCVLESLDKVDVSDCDCGGDWDDPEDDAWEEAYLESLEKDRADRENS